MLVGDTIVIGGIHVRLQGIAAPELDEDGGREAQSYLRGVAKGAAAVCELTQERTHARRVGICSVGGLDLAQLVKIAGLARDCPRYFSGRHVKAEQPQIQGCGSLATANFDKLSFVHDSSLQQRYRSRLPVTATKPAARLGI